MTWQSIGLWMEPSRPLLKQTLQAPHYPRSLTWIQLDGTKPTIAKTNAGSTSLSTLTDLDTTKPFVTVGTSRAMVKIENMEIN